MKGYVVTLMDMPQSVQVAERCRESAEKYGIKVELFPAVNKNISEAEMYSEGLEWISPDKIRKYLTTTSLEGYSNKGAVLGNFISQYRIWKKVAANGQGAIVLEHDAVFVAPVPNLTGKGDIINLGIPSYGSFTKKDTPGVYPMFSKPGGYIPGAHGYYITNRGARELVEMAREIGAAPCDIFLNNKMFPDIKELWPQVIEARDTFTTIQIEKGCEAKHNYRKDKSSYKILT